FSGRAAGPAGSVRRRRVGVTDCCTQETRARGGPWEGPLMSRSADGGRHRRERGSHSRRQKGRRGLMSYRSLLLALPLLALGCSRGGDGEGPAALGPEYDASEAAIRQHAASVRPPTGRRAVIYLALDEGDPPPAAFWERFREDAVRVE